MNADGRADLLAWRQGRRASVAIGLGRGDGAFEPRAEIPFSAVVADIAAADANGDGRADLALTTMVEVWEPPWNYYYVPYASRVFIAQEDGSFAGSAVELDPFPTFADVDDDGIPDAMGSGGIFGRGFAVRLGRGDGTFAPALVVNAGAEPGQAQVADFDADGHADLVLPSGVDAASEPAVVLLRGRGDGTFEPAERVGDAASRVEALDWDSDGARDLAAVASGVVTLRRGRGDGTFAAERTFLGCNIGYLGPIFEDLDGDGGIELSLFHTPYVATFRLDAAGGYGSELGVFLPEAPRWIESADFDRDGRIDVVAVSDAGRIQVLGGRGDGSFRDRLAIDSVWDPTCVRAADLDGDGWSDLVVANRFQVALSLFYGDPGGGFEEPVLLAIGDAPVRVATGDVDGDGHVDLVSANELGGDIAVRRATGPRTYAAAERHDVASEFQDVESADLDGDGRDDVVVLTAVDVVVFHATAQGLVRSTAVAVSGLRLATADMDGDGHLDVVVAGDPSKILMGEGDATFGPARRIDAPAAALDVALPDLDADGDADLVLALANHEVQVQTNDGTGVLAAPDFVPALGSPTGLAVADWTSDARIDVLVASGPARRLMLLHNVLSARPSVEDVRVEPAPGAVALHWSVAPLALSEILGVDVARAVTADGALTILTPQRLVAAPEMTFTDEAAPPGCDVWYSLVLHYEHGPSRVLGPHAAAAAHWPTRWKGVAPGADGLPVVRYTVGVAGATVSTSVYDVRGRLVRKLESGFRSEGAYAVAWDGRDEARLRAARGIYFVHLRLDRAAFTGRAVLLGR